MTATSSFRLDGGEPFSYRDGVLHVGGLPVDQLAEAAGTPVYLYDLNEVTVAYRRGDLVAVLDTGAYGMVMASDYNGQPRPAEVVVAGSEAAEGTAFEFATISVNDGITMGTQGMKGSLVSREVITDSIELMARSHMFDGLVVIVGCDKTIPAGAMALARLNLPGLVLYSGSIAPGRLGGEDLTIVSVFEAIGAHDAGKLDAAGLQAVEEAACPGAGACGGQFTANTMACALEFLGLSPAGANEVPAVHKAKPEVSRQAGELAVRLVRDNVLPRSILTRQAFENAITSFAASGGSTNAVLHLLAIAHEAGVPLELEDFHQIATRSPIYADLKPGGRYVATDLYRAGGLGLLSRRLLEAGLVHPEVRNVDGRTLEEIAAAAQETPGQQVIRPLGEPLKPTGGIEILYGNLAPEGCVIKLAGHHRTATPVWLGCSSTRRPASRPSRTARSDPATWSSSAMRARLAAPGCGRCCTSPRPSSAPGSPNRWRSLPTGASRAGPTASCLPTWPPRRLRAARSAWSKMAIRSPSTSPPARSPWRCPKPSWQPGGPAGGRQPPRWPGACSGSTPTPSGRPAWERSPPRLPPECPSRTLPACSHRAERPVGGWIGSTARPGST
jgi:hypothetical protein